MFKFWLISAALVFMFAEARNTFDLSVVHFNDFHARFEEQNSASGVCKPGDVCHGGFSRLFYAINNVLKEKPNSILLDAGDSFQGTLWYNMFKWNVTQKFMNMLPTTAYTLGNHEFDDYIAGVIPYVRSMKAPAIISNINDSLVPEIQGLYKKSVVVEVDGKKIGIVGVMLSTTNEIASTEKLIFLDEIDSVNKEATRLVEEEGAFTVIVLSHSGYYVDQQIAKNAVGRISLIVGAHSHTLLYTGTPPDGSKPAGPYPTIIKRETDSKNVLVVQAHCYTRYLGDITVSYDEHGEVVSWQGAPIYLGPNLPQDEEINELLQPYKEAIDAAGNRIVGETHVVLDQSNCRKGECNMGNLITDSMVWDYVDKAESGFWTYASLAIMNPGGIRTSLQVGNITFNDLVAVHPFANTFDVGVLQGIFIKELFEVTATPYSFRDFYTNVNLLQVSGFKIVYNLSEPHGSRVTSIKVLCNECSTPKYEDLDLEKKYRIIMPTFLGEGGDGFKIISDNLEEYTIGEPILDAFERYVQYVTPINTGIEERITFEGPIGPKKRRR